MAKLVTVQMFLGLLKNVFLQRFDIRFDSIPLDVVVQEGPMIHSGAIIGAVSWLFTTAEGI